MKWQIGCSGFHYKEWKGVFYPEKLAQNKWFEFYCNHFNTLELNVTFYRFPQLSFLQNWYLKSPDVFIFSVKAPRAITHYKQFVETKPMLTEFYETIQKGLKEKLGAVLFQIPASVHYSNAFLQRIIHNMDQSFTNVVEFRHLSWWNEDVFTELKKNNITFCGVSFPNLPNTIIHTTPTAYYRFHGVPKLYKSVYGSEELKNIVSKLSENNFFNNAYIYFNNTADAAAIGNAQWLNEYTMQLNK